MQALCQTLLATSQDPLCRCWLVHASEACMLTCSAGCAAALVGSEVLGDIGSRVSGLMAA